MAPTHRIVIRRRLDFLALTVSCYGLRLRTDPAPPVLERTDQQALVVLEFPPQALREQSLPPWNTGRPETALAEPSRLVFRVPDEINELAYDLPTLLGVVGFEPVLVPAAVEPGAVFPPPGPELREPTPTETALELPQRLLLSPSDHEGWSHATGPVAHDGRVELWHSRLGVRVRTEDGWRIDEYGDRLPTVRAVWARGDELPDFLADRSRSLVEPGPPSLRPEFLPGDRQGAQIVLATADWQMEGFRPEPFQAERLMLSAYGGWLSGKVVVDPPKLGPLDLEQWTHRATMGRDQYVRIVERGYLYPWGVPAAFVQVAERRPVSADGIQAAALVREEFVVVRRPLTDYAALRGLSARFDHGFPFSRIRVSTLTTPPLPPGGAAVTGVPGAFLVTCPGGAPFEFSALGTDARGQEVPLGLPAVFVRKSAAAQPGNCAPLADWWNAQTDRTRVRGFGRRIAYTPDAVGGPAARAWRRTSCPSPWNGTCPRPTSNSC
ncbi:hypothetical protein ACFQ0T_39890 [Kitasatospora gansuensis]